MKLNIEDLRRILGAKSVSRIRNLLCRPEFEKRRVIELHVGRKLIYDFSAQDLKEFKEMFSSIPFNRHRGDCTCQS